jgi:PilS N terminal
MRILLMLLIASCAMPSSGDDSTGTYYLHWNCGGQSQCADDWGANTGIQITYTAVPIQTCIDQMVAYADANTIQEWNGHVGDWCDDVSDPSELGPAPGY